MKQENDNNRLPSQIEDPSTNHIEDLSTNPSTAPSPSEPKKEALPSIFDSLRSTTSKPLQSVLDIEHYIRYHEGTKTLTKAYRQAIGIDRKMANNLKRNSIAISPSIQFLPKGRTLGEFAQETYWLMLDYDHVVSCTLDEKVKLACQSKYAMVVYRTISGMGLRILLRYQRPPGCTLTATELHQLALGKAMKHFDERLSLRADIQCSDMTRLCGFAHDEKAYFNWNAERLEITPDEVTHFYNTQVKSSLEAQAASSPSAPKRKASPRARNRSTTNSIDEITQQVKKLAERWEVKFEANSHNKYLMRFTTFCHNYGAEREDLLNWLLAEYGQQYDGKNIEDIVKCIYKHTDSFGSWHLYAPGEGYGKRPGVKAIQQWLSRQFEFRHNAVTGKFELRAIDCRFSKYYKWTEIDDVVENSLFDKMDIDGLCVSQKKLHAVIVSDFWQEYNPFHDYLNGLVGKWEKGNPDYIGELARMVSVKEDKDNFHSQKEFIYAFRKWFVAMVAGWYMDSVVNHTILVLVGRGGIFKTTYLEKLLPPELSRYYANDSSADYSNKDFLELASSKALVCLDEFEAPKGKNLSAFKSIITKQELTVRRPYDRYSSILKHNTTFCATSNKIHFLNEEENRRYLIWEVDHIENPKEKKLDYTLLYAQAVTLCREVMERGEDGKEKDWVYWLTSEDRKKQEVHNRLFMANNYLEELIRRFYRHPMNKDKNSCNLKFVTAAEILDRICINPVFRQEFANKDIIAAMARLGYERKHRTINDGYWVVEKDGREIMEETSFNAGQDSI